jgi:hypothetical protein
MKIKHKFPLAGSKVIVDKRWLGYHTTSRQQNLTIDPLYIRMFLKQLFAAPESFTFGRVCDSLGTLVPKLVDARNSMIRGNAFPMGHTVANLVSIITDHIQTAASITYDQARVFSIPLMRMLAQLDIIEIEEGVVIEDLYSVEDPIPRLFTERVGDSVVAHVLMSDVVAKAIDSMFARVEEAKRVVVRADKGGFRNANVDSIVEKIRHAVDLFDLDIKVALGRLVQYLRSMYFVFSEAVKNPEYTPLGLSDAEVAELMSYANGYFNFTYNPVVPTPTLADEKRCASCLKDLAVALNKPEVSLFEIRTAPSFQAGIEQFSVRMPADNDGSVSNYIKTGWQKPAGALYHAGIIVPYKKGVHTVGIDANAAGYFQPFFAAMEKVADYVQTDFNMSHLSVDGYSSEPAINQLTGDSGYNARFAAKVLQIIAMDVSAEFSLDVETGVVTYEFNDMIDRHVYTSTRGGEPRKRTTSSASDVLAHTLLTGANGETFWKRPSVFATMPRAITYATGLETLLPSFKELVGHTDFERDGSFVPAAEDTITFVLQLPDNSEVDAEFRLYEMMDRDIFGAADLYLEKDKSLEIVDKALDARLSELLALPDGKTKQKFLITITRMLSASSESIFGDDLLKAMQRFTGFPPSYWSKYAPQGLKFIKMKNAVTALLAVLQYLGFTSAANLSEVTSKAFALPVEQVMGE